MASEASFSRSVNRRMSLREMLLVQDKKRILLSSLERARASLSPLDFAKLCDITNKELREWLEETRRNKLFHNQTTSTLASSRQCASVVSLNSSVYNPASQSLLRGTQLTNTSRSNRLAYRPSQFCKQLNTIDENREDTEENEDTEDTEENVDTEESEDIEESGVVADSSSSSSSSSSSEDDDGEVPTTLNEWHLLLDNESLNIVGKTPNNSVVTAKKVLVYKTTGEIVTESGTFVVKGKPKVVESVPKFVYNSCKLGFPKRWRFLLAKWIEEVSDKKNSSKNKKEANTSEKKPSKPKKNEGNSTDQPTGSAKKGSKKEKSTSGNANKENINFPKTVSAAKKKTPEANKSKSGTSKTKKKEAQNSPMTTESSKKTNDKKRKMPDPSPQSSSKADQECKTKKTSKNEADQESKTKKTSSQKTSKNENRGEAPKNSKRKKPDQRPTPGGERYDVFADIGDAMDYEDAQCMTPNRMLDELSSTGIGAFTPPMESVNFLFTSGGRQQESIPTSPASSNIERNPVSDRMAKQIERKK